MLRRSRLTRSRATSRNQGVAASIGSVGDAYDNSMAEAVINT